MASRSSRNAEPAAGNTIGGLNHERSEGDRELPSQPKMSFRDVSKTFVTARGRTEALAPVNVDIAPGEFVTIVGPSGCGKSTLLMIASGLEQPSAGDVLVDGRPAGPTGPDRSVVFQQLVLFPHMSVSQNVAYGLKVAGVRREERESRVSAQIALMGLTGFEKAYPSELSGGMQQRVAIARALVLEPSVLLMDEPFGALDAQTRATLQDEMGRLRSRLNCTVMFITHSVEEAVYLGDRILVMSARPGRILRDISLSGDGDWRGLPIEVAMSRSEFNQIREEVWRLLHN